MIPKALILMGPPSFWKELFQKVKGKPIWKSCYSAYLQSGAWQAKRAAVLREAGDKCQRCIGGIASEVHHKTYDNVGDEQPGDLEAVCIGCHRDHHHIPPTEERQATSRA